MLSHFSKNLVTSYKKNKTSESNVAGTVPGEIHQILRKKNPENKELTELVKNAFVTWCSKQRFPKRVGGKRKTV